eukprot:529233_1
MIEATIIQSLITIAALINNVILFVYYVYKIFKTHKQRTILKIEWITLFGVFTMMLYSMSTIITFFPHLTSTSWVINISISLYCFTKLSLYIFLLERLFMYLVNSEGVSTFNPFYITVYRLLLLAWVSIPILLCFIFNQHSIVFALIAVGDLIINCLFSALLSRKLFITIHINNNIQNSLKGFVLLSFIATITTQIYLLVILCTNFRFIIIFMSLDSVTCAYCILLSNLYNDIHIEIKINKVFLQILACICLFPVSNTNQMISSEIRLHVPEDSDVTIEPKRTPELRKAKLVSETPDTIAHVRYLYPKLSMSDRETLSGGCKSDQKKVNSENDNTKNTITPFIPLSAVNEFDNAYKIPAMKSQE